MLLLRFGHGNPKFSFVAFAFLPFLLFQSCYFGDRYYGKIHRAKKDSVIDELDMDAANKYACEHGHFPKPTLRYLQDCPALEAAI